MLAKFLQVLNQNLGTKSLIKSDFKNHKKFRSITNLHPIPKNIRLRLKSTDKNFGYILKDINKFFKIFTFLEFNFFFIFFLE